MFQSQALSVLSGLKMQAAGVFRHFLVWVLCCVSLLELVL